MTSTQDFTCVFCNETFEDKETLQDHFRKHGDPKFNSNTKNKARSQNEQGIGSEKAEDGEMVGCDVCDEMFPSISKAITHKHKIHPDHDTKHFCPWCGKLFTMKHLYNKHMQSNHSMVSQNEDSNYHCDSCNVDFYVPSAMMYHNKFFHRQDSELPAIGHSKKVKTFNQELIQIYYCPFCGEEYNNKVNLHKHMGDDHSDENQSPDEVLRCPLCEAVFYHLDAYELHLSFHSSNDVYSDENEMSMEITDFSLETVPPIMEKVEEETKEPESEGIDKFLQLIMDESRESGNTDAYDKHKSKKHKKHKKSKKAAITLDEFLNMNKDVFGDGLDVQGIEEVPTQHVLKKCKGKKDNVVKPLPTSTLAKLKKQGIIVKSNSSLKSPVLKTNKNLTVNAGKNVPQHIPVKVQETPKATGSNELLTKLLNQSNRQIKIVKKSLPDNLCNDKILSEPDAQEPIQKLGLFNNPASYTSDTEEKTGNKTVEISHDTDNLHTNNEDSKNDIFNNGVNICNTEVEDNKNTSSQDATSTTMNTDKSNNSKDTNELLGHRKMHTESSDLSKNINQYDVDDHMGEKDTSFMKNDHLDINVNDKEVPNDNNDESNINFNENGQHENTNKTQVANKSLDVLRRLSGVITVKSSQNKDIKNSAVETEQPVSENDEDDIDENMPLNSAKILIKNMQNVTMKKSSPIMDSSAKSAETFKCLNKQVTIKPCALGNFTFKSTNESEDDSDNDCHENDHSKSMNTDKDSANFKTPVSISKQTNAATKFNNSLDMKKHIKSIPKDVPEEDNSKKMFNMDILKRLTNVTAKPVARGTNNIEVNRTSVHTTNLPKPYQKVEINKQIDQDIEIFNIDDSDSDQESSNEEPIPKQLTNSTKCGDNIATATSVNVLKNLSKNITIKSPNSTNNKNVVNMKNEKHADTFKNSMEKDIQKRNTHFQKNRITVNLNHTLKKLGNNISIKSRYSSPDSLRHQMQQDDDMEDHDNFDTNDEESDSESNSKVKISELQEDDEEAPSDYDIGYNENVIVQSPHGSNSEIEEENHDNHSDEETNEDMEKQIKSNTLVKEKSASNCLENFKRNNKELTIKSLNDKSNDYAPIGSPVNKKDEVMCTAQNSSNDMIVKTGRDAVKQDDNEAVAKNSNQTATSSSQKVTNQVNTVKTVKTFQSETIIEEITTTVTKTIRKVNQSLKQVAQNTSTPRPRLILPNQQSKQSLTVKNVQAVGTKIRNAAPSPRPAGTLPIKLAGQLVPVRPQNQIVPRQQNVFRTNAPGPSNIRKISPQSNVQKPVIGKALKISPLAMNQSVKRPSDETPGHFSCFKKPKDSLIPPIDAFEGDLNEDSVVNYSSASSSRSDFSTSATKIVKGNSVTTATQAKSEQHSEQHITKLNNMSGLKVIRTTAKQSAQVETRNEMDTTKRTTMDAIERLQKQGLLIKKPRVETFEENEHYNSESDDDFEEK